MKFLHTSDLHLGKDLCEESLIQDQKHILKEILNVIKEEEVDCVLISGDIYDKSNPSIDAVNLFNDFLVELSKTNSQIYIISGNHDSNERLNYGSEIFDNYNIHIEAIYKGQLKKYSHDNVDVYLMPFMKPSYLKKFLSEKEYEKIKSVDDMMHNILSRETIDKNKKNIILMHQFVMDGNKELFISDSESVDNVGTLDAIDVEVLKDFDYVALGHLHRHQTVKRKEVVYSGSPMKYSFGEYKNSNGVVIYDTEKDDNNKIRFIELKQLRKMDVIEGKLEDIRKIPNNNDLLKIIIEDKDLLSSPINELKLKFKNLLKLDYLNLKKDINDFINPNIKNIDKMSIEDLFKEFYKMQTDKEISEEELNIVKNIIDEIKEKENAS